MNVQMDTVDIAVIIPAYNDSRRLTLCLDALAQQTLPMSSYRVYLVDNNSTEDIESIVERYKFAVYLKELQPGSYVARNKAVQSLVKETFVAFTDADCIPAKDWLEKGVAAFRSGTADAIGGAVRVSFSDADSPNTVELYEALRGFPQQDYIAKNRFAVTANLWVRADVLSKVGLFNTELFSGGDLEWGNRLHDAGYTMSYAPKVVVTHPARNRVSELLRKIKRTAGGSYRQRHRTPTSATLFSWPELLRGFVPPVTLIRQFDTHYYAFSLTQKVRVLVLATFLKWYQTGVRLAYKFRLLRQFERL